MERTVTITRLVALLVMLGTPLTAFAQPHVSVWTTIDPHDGSRAYIGVNAEWQIVFYDTDATFGCRSGGGGPFFGFDDNNGNTVSLIGDVLVGYIEGICQNGSAGQNTSFDFGMRYFPATDTIRSRNTIWDRTFIDEEEFVTDAFGVKRLSPLTTRGSIWDFMGTYAGDDPQVIPGVDCEDPYLGDWADLRACDLQNTSLRATTNSRLVNLRGANLMRAEIWAPHLETADLTGINLIAADISTSFMTDVKLRWSDLRYANFRPATNYTLTLRVVDFTGSDLRGVRVWEGNLIGEWTTVDFRKANLAGAIFEGIDVRQALFSDTICPDGTNSNDNGGTCDLSWSPPAE